MFNEFTPIRGSLYAQRVNTALGIAFLGSVALWAAMIIWNISTGNTPIDTAIASAIDKSVNDSQ